MLQLKHKFGLNYLYDKNKNLFPSGLTPIFILLKYAIENLILNDISALLAFDICFYNNIDLKICKYMLINAFVCLVMTVTSHFVFVPGMGFWISD